IDAEPNADAAELAAAGLAELLVFVGADERGMRIEFFEAAIDHVLDELTLLVLVELADVASLYFLEHIDNELEVLMLRLRRRSRRAISDGNAEDRGCGDAQKPGEVPA